MWSETFIIIIRIITIHSTYIYKLCTGNYSRYYCIKSDAFPFKGSMFIYIQQMKYTETQLTIQFSGYVGSTAARGTACTRLSHTYTSVIAKFLTLCGHD